LIEFPLDLSIKLPSASEATEKEYQREGLTTLPSFGAYLRSSTIGKRCNGKGKYQMWGRGKLGCTLIGIKFGIKFTKQSHTIPTETKIITTVGPTPKVYK
jgi:hypothetical protein